MGIFSYIRNQIRHDRDVKNMLVDINSKILSRTQNILLSQYKNILIDKTINSTTRGVSDEKLCDNEIIVSLTTFGNRIYDVHLTIESIMQGTVKPNRIVLWLAEEEFKGKTLPRMLQLQQKRGLEIEFCEDIRSFKKIVPAMEKYPDACIVTIDDDLIYEFDILENLVNTHVAFPDDVCASRIHRIKLDKSQKPQSYVRWQWFVCPEKKSNLNFLTSGGGTLFPSHCFVKEFFNKEAFLSLCPYADDVWINAMIWMSGRHIVKSYTHSKLGCDYTESYLEQDDALWSENRCRNDIQLRSVMDKYDLYHYLVE